MPLLYYRDPDTQEWVPLSEPGEPGPMGPTGAAGLLGIAGPTGPLGPQGIAGLLGLLGPTGARGLTGDLGPTGPQGPQGAKGVTGGQGIQGPQGAQGWQGPQGPAGLTGQPVGINVRFGYVVVTPVANTPTPTPIAFGNYYGFGGFSVPPIVLVAANTTVPGTVRMVGADAITTGGCNLMIYRTNTTATGLHFIAMGA